MIIQSLTEGIMSHFFRRFLSTVMLSAMLACTAFSPLSTAVVYANAESVKLLLSGGQKLNPLSIRMMNPHPLSATKKTAPV